MVSFNCWEIASLCLLIFFFPESAVLFGSRCHMIDAFFGTYNPCNYNVSFSCQWWLKIYMPLFSYSLWYFLFNLIHPFILKLEIEWIPLTGILRWPLRLGCCQLSAKHHPQPLSWRCNLISSLLQCRKVNSCGNDTAQLTSDGSQARESVLFSCLTGHPDCSSTWSASNRTTHGN